MKKHRKEHVGPEAKDFDLGSPDPEEQSLTSLEEKYSKQMRQIFPTKIDLPWLTLKTQIEEQIDLRPDFQRRDRWSNEKRSRFIESVIMNVPVPPVFLGEKEYGKYVVLDGRQRLTAAYKFLSNELRLEGLEIWQELNGLTYAEIKKQGMAPTIERRFLPAILLQKESSPEVKYEVFDRLNTGGVIAEPMEVRNAIFPGPFNALLHELSSDEGFRRLWGIPTSEDPVALERNALYREMADLELVLRFFALREGTLGGMRFKDRLSDFMKTRNTAYRKDPTPRLPPRGPIRSSGRPLRIRRQTRVQRSWSRLRKTWAWGTSGRPFQSNAVIQRDGQSIYCPLSLGNSLPSATSALIREGCLPCPRRGISWTQWKC